MARKGQKFKNISLELTNQIIQDCIAGKGTHKTIGEKYGIACGTVNTIMYKYNKRGIGIKLKRGRTKDTKNMTIEELKVEVDILKKFQAFLKPQHEKR
jgi:hypothetical protein